VTLQDILQTRLINQRVSGSRIKDITTLTHWFGAIQAQDYYGSLWAISLRTGFPSEEKILKAVADRLIVRSWPMRGTIHYVAAEDLRWMLALLSDRVLARCKGLFRSSELTGKVFSNAEKFLVTKLRGRRSMTRAEVYEVWEKNKIPTDNQRGLHILMLLALNGIICYGSHRGAQPTFALLDEWLPSFPKLTREEALRELATRYFQSHGPATLRDFTWWSGLSATDAKKAVALVEDKFHQEIVGGQPYWLGHHVARAKSSLRLLPAYDEYTVAYKDRSAFLDPAYGDLSGNGIFRPVILDHGILIGIWKRTILKDRVEIKATPFKSFTKIQKEGIGNAAAQYGAFLGMKVDLRF
jgi:Winged helix DNA-binding domain